MNMSESINELAAALAKAQGDSGVVAKSGHNTFDKYHYGDMFDHVKAMRAAHAHGLAIVNSIEDVAYSTVQSAKGNDMTLARVKMLSRVVHTSGQWIEVFTTGEASDRGDKAVYKAITGARKYALSCLFNLASADEPEQHVNDAPPRPAFKPQDNGTPTPAVLGAASADKMLAAVDAAGMSDDDLLAALEDAGFPGLDVAAAAQWPRAVGHAVRAILDSYAGNRS